MPHGSVVKSLPTSARHRCRFDPWVGKIPWRRKWQPTPVFLPGKCMEPGRLYSQWGHKESDTTERLITHTHTHTHTHTKGLAYVKPLWHFVSQAGSSNSSSFVLAGGFSLQQVDSASFLFPSGWLVTCFDSWQCSRNDAGPDPGPVRKRTKGWNSKTPC